MRCGVQTHARARDHEPGLATGVKVTSDLVSGVTQETELKQVALPALL
jgi:hypothetical protein